MCYSITQVLYDFLHNNRIMTEVAQEMGRNSSTLSAELRPNHTRAKLGADELLPLFKAIRVIGYGDQLDGILHEFMMHARGDNVNGVTDSDFIPLTLQVNHSVGLLSSVAERVSKSTDEKELVHASSILRAEALPVLVRMGTIIDSRLDKIRANRTLGGLRIFVW
jgi:hypothetical protein